MSVIRDEKGGTSTVQKTKDKLSPATGQRGGSKRGLVMYRRGEISSLQSKRFSESLANFCAVTYPVMPLKKKKAFQVDSQSYLGLVYLL